MAEPHQKTETIAMPSLQTLQRAHGQVNIGVGVGLRGTALRTLRQSGCLKARFPRPHGPGLEAVLINVSGGVADGDVLGLDFDAGAGSSLTISTPGAERVYGAMDGAPAARIDMRATIGCGGRLDYLPQETLLFDGAALDRSLTIEMHERGSFLGVESLIFGRALSGEVVARLRVRDGVSVRRAGRLIHRDIVRLQGDVGGVLAASGGRAVATILYVAPDAEARLATVRDAMEGFDGGASAWDGLLLARLVAGDGQGLRRGVVAALSVLREDALPRLWGS